MTILFNQPKLKSYRLSLRNNQTITEGKLWFHLRNRQLGGYRFLRQYSIGTYILDFYCPKIRLGIEVDGSQHIKTKHYLYDKQRTEYLEKLGIILIRFWDNEVLQDIDGVLEVILTHLINPSSPPLSAKGEGLS